MRKLDDAMRYVDVSQLALGTQCGFSSDVQGNALGEDDQWRKLELIGRVADTVWGR
jgi:5-methyltetrahydropteroyltriglutamate--homocysteine methyltransferase